MRRSRTFRMTTVRPFAATNGRAGRGRRVHSWLAPFIWGLPALGVVNLIKAYKVLISYLFTGSCRFLPSCSSYAQEAVTLHGALRGSWLAVRRISRCHPLGRSGFDPVPGSRAADNF